MNKYLIESIASIKERPRSAFSVVSLFAGGGGSSIGYNMAGGKVLLINEFIDEAVKTYRSNWPDTKIIHDDVRNITGQQILDEIGLERGGLDILDGSPPCSAFSTSGKREALWGKEKIYSDKKQSSVENLFLEYIRILNDVQPKCFVAENVSGLAKGVSRGFLNEILRGLRQCGYYVSCRILDAQWLDVPQMRERTIFVGVRNDIMRDEYLGVLHPKPNMKRFTLNQAFEGLTFTNKDREETDMTKYKIWKLLCGLKEGEKHKKRFNLVKQSKHKPANCITATTGVLSAAAPCHWDNRRFTVSEVKRIMSVPDDYILTGDYRKQVERLGRMVAPHMMKAIAENLVTLGVFDENS